MKKSRGLEERWRPSAPRPGRWCRGFGPPSIAALLLLALLLWPGATAAAAEPPCQPADSAAAVVAAPDDARAASLPGPFRIEPWPADREQLLTDAQQEAATGLNGIGAPACYTALLPTIAARTVFLSPFEFLVAGYYDHDWATRDALLQLYRDDPQQAVRRLSGIWPSPRAEMLVRTPAFFDLDTNQIYVNLGVTTPEQAPNVVVHEFWHALANVQLSQRADGSVSRTTGFWTEIRPSNAQVWRPLDEELPGGVPTYLMNEAVAIEMEVAATGREHPGMRSDLLEAREALRDLFGAAGRSRVLRLYLGSRSEELKAIASQAAGLAGG